MSSLLQATALVCPYCGEEIELVIDLSVDNQEYVEDCFVCCRPIVVSYRTHAGALGAVSVRMENE